MNKFGKLCNEPHSNELQIKLARRRQLNGEDIENQNLNNSLKHDIALGTAQKDSKVSDDITFVGVTR